MYTPLFFGMIGFVAFASLWLGIRAKSETKTTEDYFLGGRKLGFFSLAFTLLATQLGGGTLVGAAEEAFHKGWYVLFYPLGTCLGLAILSMGFGSKLREMKLSTIPELFERVYNSPRLRQVAAVLSIASLFFILIGMGIATRKFFYSLGWESPWIFFSVWAVVIAYTVAGGLRAVVSTDILQAAFVLLALGAVCVFAFFNPSASVSSGETMVATSTDVPWIAWLLMPLMFVFIEQDMGQRCFAAKSPKLVSRAAFFSAAVLFFASVAPIYLGVRAAQEGLIIKEGSSVLYAAVESMGNPLILTIMAGAILMAIISTADSLLCSISSNLACDFPMLQKKGIWSCRVITLVVGIFTMSLSYSFDNVISMLVLAYEMSVSVLFVPIIAVILIEKPKKIAAILAMTIGGGCFCLFQVWAPPFPKEVLTLVFAFVGYALGQRVLEREGVKDIYIEEVIEHKLNS